VNLDEFVIAEKVIKELSEKLSESEAQVASVIQVCVLHWFLVELPYSSRSYDLLLLYYLLSVSQSKAHDYLLKCAACRE